MAPVDQELQGVLPRLRVRLQTERRLRLPGPASPLQRPGKYGKVKKRKFQSPTRSLEFRIFCLSK